MPTPPEPQTRNSAGTPEQTSGASTRTRNDILNMIRSRYLELYRDRQACMNPAVTGFSQDYGAIEQRGLASSLQQDDSDADAQRSAITPLRNSYLLLGTATGRMEVRNPMHLNPRTTANPWPFETGTNIQPTQEPIMASNNDTFIVNRIGHEELEAHLDRLLAHYAEGTAEGDDLKARFEVQSSLTMRDEETAAKFRERYVFLASCYASKSFPPDRNTLKHHVLNMLTTAARDVLAAYGVYAASANGNGYAVLDTGRGAVFRALEAAVNRRVQTTPDADPSSLRFYRDAPPTHWVYVDKLDRFVQDKQAHDEELRREKALVGAMDVGEDVKQLMHMYLTRAGNNYANALRYYHTVNILNLFRNYADNCSALLFYSYKVKDKEIRGLQYAGNDGDFITGFGGY